MRCPVRTIRTAALLVCFAAATGCGRDSSSTSPQQEDERLTTLVTGTPDRAMSPVLAKDHFATVPPKDQLDKYAKLTFEPAGPPQVAGDSATVPVRVLTQDGTARGEVTWEFVKSGDRWKLKSAPLP